MEESDLSLSKSYTRAGEEGKAKVFGGSGAQQPFSFSIREAAIDGAADAKQRTPP